MTSKYTIECKELTAFSVTGAVDLELVPTKTGFTVNGNLPFKLKLSGGEITAESKSTGGSVSIVSGGGGNVFQSFVGGSMMSIGSIGGRGGSVIVDGVDVTEFVRQQKNGGGGASSKREEKQDDSFGLKWEVISPTPFRRLSVQGASDVRLASGFQFPPQRFSASVSGSGSIQFPSGSELNAIVSTVTGSGDIDFNGAHVQLLTATVTGSGDIKGFLAKEEAVLNVTGSGDITGRALKGCSVDKATMGSGDISVRRV